MTSRRVYYNSACPVCRAGVARQRRRMQERGAAGDLEWRDINDQPDALAARGVGIDDVRRKLHVEDDSGHLHVGAAAFVALWRDTPGQRWLGRLFSAPAIAALGRWAYDAFAGLLYRWNRARGRW